MPGAVLRILDGGRMKTHQNNESAMVQHLHSVCTTKRGTSDFPPQIPRLSDEDIKFYAELSDRETGANFFDKKKR